MWQVVGEVRGEVASGESLRSRRPGRAGGALMLAASILQLLAATSAFGEIEREKILRRLDFKRVDGGIEAVVHFNRPIRYVRHSPKDRGKIVRIELAPLGTAAIIDEGVRRRESLKSTIGKQSPLIEIVHERSRGQGSLLIVRFRKMTQFEIRPGSRARSVTIFMKIKAPRARPPRVVSPRPGQKAEPAGSARILAEGRKAMTAAEYGRAAALFEIVLSGDAKLDKGEDDREAKREARELLGLARERNGQVAHARAEYEEYIKRYPEGEAAQRVRQRLQALITAESRPSPILRKFVKDDDDDWVEIFGDASLSYLRGEDLAGDRDNTVFTSALIADLDLSSRAEVNGYQLIGDLSLGHDHDFAASKFASGSEDITRVSVLSVEAQDPTRTLSGVMGRQTLRNGGVLGRFDGMVVRGQLDEYLLVSGAFGFPLKSNTASGFNEDRVFMGTAADLGGYIDGATAQLFMITQLNQTFLERFALGTELNYVGQKGYARGFLDYDVYFNLLNLALVSGSYNINDDTQLHGFLQTQTVPFFTLATALQGQVAADLKALDKDFSKKEIANLARDRTATSYTVTLGGSHWLDSELQMSADLTFVRVGSTPASGGVAATPKTNADISASVQVTKNNLLFPGDISSGSFSFSDREITDGYRLFLRSRIPLHKRLHVDPRLSLDFRDHRQGGNDLLTIRPSVQLTWDWRDFTTELEAGLDSLVYFGAQNPDPEVSYIVEMQVRYEF